MSGTLFSQLTFSRILSGAIHDYDYDLPQGLIAQKPAEPRDHSRLLIYNRADRSVRDDLFTNIGRYLPKNSALVVNNSRVERCRLLFHEEKTELFVTKAFDPFTIEAMVRPGKRFKPGTRTELFPGVFAETLSVTEDGLRRIRLSEEIDSDRFEPFRYTPFPPYIERDESLAGRYQTVYARDEGSKAAPTAGLHFTPELMQRLTGAGHPFCEVTLHVGMGTFAPVKTDRIEEHVMHSEWFQVSEEQAKNLNAHTERTAVGTTSVRVLESMRTENGQFVPQSGDTDIFIRPGYTFRHTDHIITNFHLPKSTLLMLVSAFIGLEEMHRIYRHAIEKRYRFYSFGDAMLLL